MKVMARKRGYAVDFAEEIQRGVEVLDRHDPRWFDNVNLDKLSLDDPYVCVLGQLAMSSLRAEIEEYFSRSDGYYNYYQVIELLGDQDETDEQGERYGFTISHTNLYERMLEMGLDAPDPDRDYEEAKPFYNRAWEQLTQQWAGQIEKLRADAGTMTGGQL